MRRYAAGLGLLLGFVFTSVAQDVRTPPAAQPRMISPDLLKLLMGDLDAGDAQVRLKAIERLGAHGLAAEPAAKRLSELLADEAVVRLPDNTRKGYSEACIGDRAAWALAQIGKPTVPDVKQVLKTSQGHVRERAAMTLARINETMDETWAWAITDKDSNVMVRRLAAEQLGKSQGEVPEKALIAGLKDESIYVRRAAIEGLARVGRKDAVAPLVALLADETKGQSKVDSPLGAYAAISLGQIGAPAVPALIVALDDPKFAGKDNARTALVLVKDPKALDMLLQALKHKNPLVRAPAAEALANANGPEAIEAAIAMTQDEDPRVRQSAYYALCWIHSARSNDQFVRAGDLARKALREDAVPEVRASAAQSLARWPFDRDKNAQALVAALDDSSPLVRANAATALSRLTPGEPGITALVKRLRDQDRQVRKAAAMSLGRIGTPARNGADEIARLLKDKDRLVRDEAATALGYIGNPVAINPLIDALEAAMSNMKDSENKVALWDSCNAIRKSLGMLTGMKNPYPDAESWRQWQQGRSAGSQPSATQGVSP